MVSDKYMCQIKTNNNKKTLSSFRSSIPFVSSYWLEVIFHEVRIKPYSITGLLIQLKNGCDAYGGLNVFNGD